MWGYGIGCYKPSTCSSNPLDGIQIVPSTTHLLNKIELYILAKPENYWNTYLHILTILL